MFPFLNELKILHFLFKKQQQQKLFFLQLLIKSKKNVAIFP